MFPLLFVLDVIRWPVPSVPGAMVSSVLEQDANAIITGKARSIFIFIIVAFLLFNQATKYIPAQPGIGPKTPDPCICAAGRKGAAVSGSANRRGPLPG
jgi:hypothetical protein